VARNPLVRPLADRHTRRSGRKENPPARLDVPLDTRRWMVRRPTYNPDAFGRLAEEFARFMGTARFLIYMSLFVATWLLWNWLGPAWRWDPYPYIFLTLMLSLQASYAAPLILLAQNRQEDRDRVLSEQDRNASARSRADMEFLAREVASLRMAVGEVATRDYVRSELRTLMGDLEERLRELPGDPETTTAGEADRGLREPRAPRPQPGDHSREGGPRDLPRDVP
jgi:uncharacterized membrane protein